MVFIFISHQMGSHWLICMALCVVLEPVFLQSAGDKGCTELSFADCKICYQYTNADKTEASFTSCEYTYCLTQQSISYGGLQCDQYRSVNLTENSCMDNCCGADQNFSLEAMNQCKDQDGQKYMIVIYVMVGVFVFMTIVLSSIYTGCFEDQRQWLKNWWENRKAKGSQNRESLTSTKNEQEQERENQKQVEIQLPNIKEEAADDAVEQIDQFLFSQ